MGNRFDEVRNVFMENLTQQNMALSKLAEELSETIRTFPTNGNTIRVILEQISDRLPGVISLQSFIRRYDDNVTRITEELNLEDLYDQEPPTVQ